MAITCNAVLRWYCTDGKRSWWAGPDYRYNGKLATETEAVVSPLPPTPPEPAPTPEPEPTPPTTNLDWQANWQEPRTLTTSGDDVQDPKDSRCRLLDVGNPKAKATIGNGELITEGGSPRFYINGQYESVEFATECKIEASPYQVIFSACNNHEDRANKGFGGYPLYIDVSQGATPKMFFKKEAYHEKLNGHYSGRLASVNIPSYQAGQWFKIRVRITRQSNGSVKCESWFNEKEYSSVVDSGQIQCANTTDKKPFTGIGQSCFLRVNSIGGTGNAKVRYRNTKITKI